MLAIFLRIIKDRRLMLIIYLLINIGLLWMYVGLFPSFKDQSVAMADMLKSYPESFLKAFNFDIASFNTIEGFLSTEQYSFMWPLLMILMTLGFAGGAIAGEIETGTAEILLSQPITRTKIFIARYLAGFVSVVIFVFISVFSAIPFMEIYNTGYKLENFSSLTILAFLFSLAVYSIGMLFSAAFSDKGKVFFMTGGILVLMYILNIVASIKDSLSDLKYASFFYYFNPANALIKNEIDNWSYLIFLGTAVLCFIVGIIYFSKRDITV